MILETSENLQDQAGRVEQYDIRPPVMRKGPYHPSESDLLEYALEEFNGPVGAEMEAHLAGCLYCRIRINRIRRCDPRLEPPRHAPSLPISEEILGPLATNPPAEVTVGQVWLGQCEHRQVIVWVRSARLGTITAHPVTPDIDYVDDLSLIVELPNIGCPAAVVSSLVSTVPRKNLVAHLGDLDIESDLQRLNEAARNGTRTDLLTGRPITDPTDARIEFRQMLGDDLASIDPIIEPDDEDDYMLSDGWEPGLVSTIPGPCHPRHPSEPDLLGYALGELNGPAGADVQAHLADCLFCRIRLNRMKRCDPRLEPPRHAPTRPQIPKEILRPLAADPPADVKPGQVWLAGRPGREQVMVWIRGVFPHAIMAHAVTPDIDSVEDLSLIADLPAIGRPVAVVSSVSNTVPRETLAAHLGDLDVKSDLREAREAALSRTPTDLRTGRPITDPADERNEFLHMLADNLADLNPIIEPDDDDAARRSRRTPQSGPGPDQGPG